MIEIDKFKKIIAHFEKEIANLRTGRAMPNLVENLLIDAYGSRIPLNQAATISVPEPQTLFIQPWDINLVKTIEKSIRESVLDFNPIVDGKIIRINFPPLTEEKRKELVKILKKKSEETKIKLRTIREEMLKKIKKDEKDKLISEDERFRSEKELQNIVDEQQKIIITITEKKEKDLMTI